MVVMTSWYERYLHDYILIQSWSQQTSIDWRPYAQKIKKDSIMLQFMYFFWSRKSSVWSLAAWYIKSTLPRSVPRWRTPDCGPSLLAQTRRWERSTLNKDFFLFLKFCWFRDSKKYWISDPTLLGQVSLNSIQISYLALWNYMAFIFVSAYLSFLKCNCEFVFTCRGFPSTWRRSLGPSHLWWDPLPPTRSRGVGWRQDFLFALCPLFKDAPSTNANPH